MRFLCAFIDKVFRVYDDKKCIGFIVMAHGSYYPFVYLPLNVIRPGQMMRSLDTAKTVVILMSAGRIV